MITEKLIPQNIQEQFVQVIQSAIQKSAEFVLFHTEQKTEQCVHRIYGYTTNPLERLFDSFPDIKQSDIIFLCRLGANPLTPTKTEQELAWLLDQHGVGFYLLHPSADRVYCLAQAGLPVTNHRPLSLDTIADPLKAGGALSQKYEHYEPRTAQIALLEFIASHFNRNTIGVAEGGTGVGKSFAYLIPAFQWVMQNNERVVISTATINLQQQLVSKDIPFIKELLNSHVKVVLVKGKQNYLCLQHLDEVLAEEQLFLKKDDPLSRIAAWAQTTKTGDKSDLPFSPSEELWGRVSTDTEVCLGSKCPHYAQCFVFKARKEAMQAQILVVNHHLFFADVVLRSRRLNASLSILPPYHKVIFDEAHHLESAATHFFSNSFSYYSIQRLLLRLQRRRTNQEAGLLMQLTEALPAQTDSGPCLQKTRDAIEKLHQALDNLQAKNALSTDTTVRLQKHITQAVETSFLHPLEKVYLQVQSLLTQIESLYKIAELHCAGQPMVIELGLVYKQLEDLAELMHQFLNYAKFDNIVFWVEQRKTRSQALYSLYTATPLDITSLLDRYLYQQRCGIIMVSATLTFEKKFDFFLNKMGLIALQKNYSCQLFASPFNYQERTLFLIPSDFPAIDREQYFNHIAYRFISDVILQNPGRGILVLFTSYWSLRNCAETIQPFLQKKGVLLLKQGDMDRQKLIQNFVQHKGSVLFGTDSFWEGIDIDNNILKIVVIFKLPFQPPNKPLLQAKQELIEKMGGNAFMQLQVPEAAIKLKQGFGRLMRKTTDYGVIMLLDSRIMTKKYGHLFIDTLPKNKRHFVKAHNVLAKAQKFLDSFQETGENS